MFHNHQAMMQFHINFYLLWLKVVFTRYQTHFMNAAFVIHVQTSHTATNDVICSWCKFSQGLQLRAWSSYSIFFHWLRPPYCRTIRRNHNISFPMHGPQALFFPRPMSTSLSQHRLNHTMSFPCIVLRISFFYWPNPLHYFTITSNHTSFKGLLLILHGR